MTGAPPGGCFSETLTSEQFVIVAALNVFNLVYSTLFSGLIKVKVTQGPGINFCKKLGKSCCKIWIWLGWWNKLFQVYKIKGLKADKKRNPILQQLCSTVYFVTATEEMEVSESHSRAWENMMMISRGVRANIYIGNASSYGTENSYSEEKSSIVQ